MLKERAKYEQESRTAPLKLMELKGSLANLKLVYELQKDRLDMVDKYKTPDAATLYADARNAIDDAFGRFNNHLADTDIKIDMDENSNSIDKTTEIIRSINDALEIADTSKSVMIDVPVGTNY